MVVCGGVHKAADIFDISRRFFVCVLAGRESAPAAPRTHPRAAGWP